MIWFLKWAVRLVLVVLTVTMASFVIVSVLPGDTVSATLGMTATDDAREAARSELRLDDPVPVRYGAWLADAARGDLGTSYRTNEPVTESIAERLPVTLELVGISQLLAVAAAIPLAIASARRPASTIDRLTTGATLGAMAIPAYVIAVALLSVFAVRLGWFPITGYTRLLDHPVENLRSIFLPCVALALPEVAVYTRVLRAELVDTFGQDHLWLARSKGLTPARIMLRHALPASMAGLLTIAAVTTSRMLGGTILVEQIFSLPGLGRFVVDAINTRDHVALQGVVVVLATGYVLVAGLMELAHRLIDPRIRA